jgi:hypothetical protein
VTFDFIPNQGSDDVRVIVVGEAQLLPLIMARNPRLGEDAAREYLKSIAPAQHAQLTEDYVREEVMYRQAIALGLDNNNYNANNDNGNENNDNHDNKHQLQPQPQRPQRQ